MILIVFTIICIIVTYFFSGVSMISMITSAFLFNFSSSVTICPIVSSASIQRGDGDCFEKCYIRHGFLVANAKKSRQREILTGLLSLRRRPKANNGICNEGKSEEINHEPH